MIRRKDAYDMDGTSWQDASIAMASIVSGAVLLCVIVWQVSRIIQTGMQQGHIAEGHSRNGSPEQVDKA